MLLVILTKGRCDYWALCLLGDWWSMRLLSYFFSMLCLSSRYSFTFLLVSFNLWLVLYRACMILWTFYIACWIREAYFFYPYRLDLNVSRFITSSVLYLYNLSDGLRGIVIVLIGRLLSIESNSDLVSMIYFLSFYMLALTSVKKWDGLCAYNFFYCTNYDFEAIAGWLVGLNCEYFDDLGEFFCYKNSTMALLSCLTF